MGHRAGLLARAAGAARRTCRDGGFPVELLLADPAGYLTPLRGCRRRPGGSTWRPTSWRAPPTPPSSTRPPGCSGLVDGELLWTWDIAAFGEPLQSYASMRMERVDVTSPLLSRVGRGRRCRARRRRRLALRRPDGRAARARGRRRRGRPVAPRRGHRDRRRTGSPGCTRSRRQHLEHLAPRTSTETLVLSPHGHIEHAAGVVDDGDHHVAAHRDGARARRVARLDAVRSPGRGRRRHGRLGGDRRAGVGRGRRGRARHLARPVADDGRRAAPATGRRTPSIPAATAPGDWSSSRATSCPSEALARERAGWRLAGTWATEALRVEAARPRAADRGRPPDPPARAGLAAHRRAPGQGLLPGPGDRRAGAQHGPAAAPAGDAAPRRVGARDRRGRAPRSGRTTARSASSRRSPATTCSVRSRSPWSSATCRRTLELVVDCDGGPVAAAQEVVVPAEGVSIDRPAARGRDCPGLGPGPVTRR